MYRCRLESFDFGGVQGNGDSYLLTEFRKRVNFLYPFFKFSALIYGARRLCGSRGAPARNPYDLMEYVCDCGDSLLFAV